MREKNILKWLEIEREKEAKWRENKVNNEIDKIVREDKNASKAGKSKGRKWNDDEIMNKISDLVEGWIINSMQDTKEFSVIPKIKGMNIGVLLKGFKDALVERAEEEGKFDPMIYKRYEENGDFDFDIMNSDDLESKANETLNLNKDQLDSE